jgi:GntR family transcriptional regulator
MAYRIAPYCGPVDHRALRSATNGRFRLATMPQPGPPQSDVVQHGSSIPESRQLAAILRRKIRSGELARGSRLPSRADLAEQYGIASVTATKAIKILVRDGLIYTEPSYGTFVGPPPDPDAEV